MCIDKEPLRGDIHKKIAEKENKTKSAPLPNTGGSEEEKRVGY